MSGPPQVGFTSDKPSTSTTSQTLPPRAPIDQTIPNSSAVASLGGSLKSIIIMDTSGSVLVERFYDWPETLVTTEVYNLSSLIKSLYQFSRELKDGSLLSVDFEGYPGSPMSRKSKQRTLQKPSAQVHRGLSSPFQTMRMMCKSSEIIVALFVDMNGELNLELDVMNILGAFLDHIKDAFMMVHGDIFASMRDNNSVPGSVARSGHEIQTPKTSPGYNEAIGKEVTKSTLYLITNSFFS